MKKTPRYYVGFPAIQGSDKIDSFLVDWNIETVKGQSQVRFKMIKRAECSPDKKPPTFPKFRAIYYCIQFGMISQPAESLKLK